MWLTSHLRQYGIYKTHLYRSSRNVAANLRHEEWELKLMGRLWHSQVLSVDAVYVDLVEELIWWRIRCG